MPKLVRPHGAGDLKPLLLSGDERHAEFEKAETLPRINMTSREVGDLIMMGIGAFTPLEGFMGHDDWRGVCGDYKTSSGLFWPVPITLSVSKDKAGSLKENSEAALVDGESGKIMGTIRIQEKYSIDKAHECQQVFKTTDMEHPGVAKVMAQEDVNIAGPVKALSEGVYPDKFKGVYMRPEHTRAEFAKRGWRTVAALQLRNPMHRSHEYLAKVAIEVCDGLLIHQLVGNLKEGDIPAEVRVKCIDTLVEHYFVPNTAIQAGYPMDMRYAGPREALLHAVFRQNYGCSHLLVGRDHAGVGNYYGPFDAHHIFDEIPKGSLELQPLKIDWTFHCYKCGGMASARTCPHGKDDRLLLSGTMLRKNLSEGAPIPPEFSRPEVLEILQEYYQGLTEKVEIKLHRGATGVA